MPLILMHGMQTNDPTAHAEVTCIRKACARLGRFDLSDCTISANVASYDEVQIRGGGVLNTVRLLTFFCAPLRCYR